MAVPDRIRANVETPPRAAGNGDLASMECTDASNGIPRYVLAAVQRDDGGEYLFTPFGHLAERHLHETYRPPE